MRKRLHSVILLIFIAISLYAAPSGALGAYSPLALRIESMGGAGVASARYEEVMYANPALVSRENQYAALPSLSITLYNFNKLIQPGGALDIFLTQNEGQEDITRAINQLINSIGSGEGDVFSAQAGFGFISGITGLSLDMGIDLHSIGSGGESSTLVMEANLAASLALAMPFTVAENHTFSFGIGAHLIFRGFSLDDMYDPSLQGGLNAGSLISIYNDEDSLGLMLNRIPVAFGFAIPLDFGFAYSYRDIFTLAFAAKNVNGRYRMQTYSGINQLYYMLTGGYLGSSSPGSATEGINYSFDTPLSLDAGFAVSTPDEGLWEWIDVTFACDIVDLAGLFSQPVSLEELILRSRLGLEVRLMNTFDFRAGLNSGYLSFGFTFDFQIFTIDLLYATHEYGKELGDKPLDMLSIAFTLGIEN